MYVKYLNAEEMIIRQNLEEINKTLAF